MHASIHMCMHAYSYLYSVHTLTATLGHYYHRGCVDFHRQYVKDCTAAASHGAIPAHGVTVLVILGVGLQLVGLLDHCFRV